MSPELRQRSILEISEADLIGRLLDDPHTRSSLLAIRGFPRGAACRVCVPLSGLPGSPRGDVDILACAPERPERAVAVEVKRIKAEIGAARARLNKLREFERGVRQANRLAALGFSQVYLWVFVAVDSRGRNEGRVTYEGLTPPLQTEIAATVSTGQLHDRVGLILYDFVQPMDTEPLVEGSSGGTLMRLAKEVEQAPALTAWVRQILARDGRSARPRRGEQGAQRKRAGRRDWR